MNALQKVWKILIASLLWFVATIVWFAITDLKTSETKTYQQKCFWYGLKLLAVTWFRLNCLVCLSSLTDFIKLTQVSIRDLSLKSTSLLQAKQKPDEVCQLQQLLYHLWNNQVQSSFDSLSWLDLGLWSN